MRWKSFLRRRAGPDSPDEEGIILDNATERAFLLATYSLADEEGLVSADVAFEVTRLLYLKWRQDASIPPKEISPDDESSTNHHQVPRNRSFDIDLTAFAEIEPYRWEWINNTSRPLDTQTVDCWVMEETVNYALKRRAMYVSVAIGNVLFSYHNSQVQTVMQELCEDLLYTTAKYKDAEFRRAKRFTLNHFFKKNKKGEFIHSVGRFLREEQHPEDYNEKRLAARSNSAESFEFTEQTLKHLTPLRPICPFPNHFYEDHQSLLENGLDYYVTNQGSYQTPDGRERVLMHVLLDPKCWFPVYELLDMESPKMKSAMPDYSTDPRVDPTRRPPNRKHLPRLSKVRMKNIKWRLRQFISQHKNFSARSVKIIANNEECTELSLDHPRTIPGAFVLSEDENIIKICGFDGADSLLLGMHILPWGRQQVGEKPVRYVTELDGGRRLEFLVRYNKDEDGEPTSAEVDVTYAVAEQRAVATPPLKSLAAALWAPIQAAGLTSAPRAAALLLLVGLAGYLLSRALLPDGERISPKAVSRSEASVGSGAINPKPSSTSNSAVSDPHAATVSNTNSLLGLGQNKSSREDKPAATPPRREPGEERAVREDIARLPLNPKAQVNLKSLAPRGLNITRESASAGGAGSQTTARSTAGRRGRTLNNVSGTRPHAQTARVRGKGQATVLPAHAKLFITVTDTNNKSLPSALIEFRAHDRKIAPRGISTNDLGKAQLCEVDSGIYDFTVVKTGFYPTKGLLFIQKAGVTKQRIILRPQQGGLRLPDPMLRTVPKRGGALDKCQPPRPASSQLGLTRAGISHQMQSARQRPAHR